MVERGFLYDPKIPATTMAILDRSLEVRYSLIVAEVVGAGWGVETL